MTVFSHHLYSVFLTSLSIFEIYIKFTAKTWSDQISIYARWSTVTRIIFRAINMSFKILVLRKVHACGLYKFSSIVLDSVYMSQNVLNREIFQIQVKKRVSCCLHMKLLWSSALENILNKHSESIA